MMPRTLNRDGRFYLIIAGIILLDQVSKFLAGRFITDPILFLSSHIGLAYRTNTGAAFSLLSGQRILLIVLAILAIIYFVHISAGYRKDPLTYFSLALIVGGAAGNLIDRLLRGHVVDFLYTSFWPTFNIADSAITLGAIGVIVSGALSWLSARAVLGRKIRKKKQAR